MPSASAGFTCSARFPEMGVSTCKPFALDLAACAARARSSASAVDSSSSTPSRSSSSESRRFLRILRGGMRARATDCGVHAPGAGIEGGDVALETVRAERKENHGAG